MSAPTVTELLDSSVRPMVRVQVPAVVPAEVGVMAWGLAFAIEVLANVRGDQETGDSLRAADREVTRLMQAMAAEGFKLWPAALEELGAPTTWKVIRA